MEKNEPENLSLGQAIKSCIKEWLLCTSTHGLPNIARHDRVLIKIIWAICFCVSTGVCSFLVMRSINSYLDFDVFSKYDVIYETPTVFPTVTICNQNAFITDEAFVYVKKIMDLYNQSMESIADETNMLWYRTPGLKVKQALSNAKFLAIINTENSNETVALRKSFGLPLDQFIISCEFESTECSQDDFEWHFDILYGSCYRYGKKQPKYTNKAGNYDGILSCKISSSGIKTN